MTSPITALVAASLPRAAPCESPPPDMITATPPAKSKKKKITAATSNTSWIPAEIKAAMEREVRFVKPDPEGGLRFTDCCCARNTAFTNKLIHYRIKKITSQRFVKIRKTKSKNYVKL